MSELRFLPIVEVRGYKLQTRITFVLLNLVAFLISFFSSVEMFHFPRWGVALCDSLSTLLINDCMGSDIRLKATTGADLEFYNRGGH